MWYVAGEGTKPGLGGLKGGLPAASDNLRLRSSKGSTLLLGKEYEEQSKEYSQYCALTST